MICVSYTRALPWMNIFQNADSISLQNQRIREYLDGERELNLAKKYSDRKASVEAEESFERMISDGILRKFECVIVASFSYTAKNLWNAKRTLGDVFYPAGIHFIVTEDGFDSRKVTKEEVEAYLKKKECEYRSRTAKKRTKTGSLPKGPVPYGYQRSKGGRWIRDEKTACYVRKIYQWFASDLTRGEILRKLEVLGAPTPREREYEIRGYQRKEGGWKWSQSTVERILTNSQYLDLEQEDGGNGLLDPDLFQLVQRKFEGQKKKVETIRENYKRPNVFAFRIFCKECGVRMHCITARNAEEKGAWFQCSAHGCQTVNIDENMIESQVLILLGKERDCAGKLRRGIVHALEEGKEAILWENKGFFFMKNLWQGK